MKNSFLHYAVFRGSRSRVLVLWLAVVALGVVAGTGWATEVDFEEGYTVGQESLIGQGGIVLWANWYSADKVSPFEVVDDDGNQVLRSLQGDHQVAKSAGIKFPLDSALADASKVRLSFRFRSNGPFVPVGQFESQVARLILFDQELFMVGFGANGVVFLYDGEKGKNASWAKMVDGKAWEMEPGMWHTFEAVIDLTERSFTASIDGRSLPANDGSDTFRLDSKAAKGSPQLLLASINWGRGFWTAFEFDDITVEAAQ